MSRPSTTPSPCSGPSTSCRQSAQGRDAFPARRAGRLGASPPPLDKGRATTRRGGAVVARRTCRGGDLPDGCRAARVHGVPDFGGRRAPLAGHRPRRRRDPDRGAAHASHWQKQRRIVPRKGGAAPYWRFIFPALAERLTAHLAALVGSDRGRDGDFVLATRTGRPLSQRNAARALANAADAAGLGKVTPTISAARSARSRRAVASIPCRPQE